VTVGVFFRSTAELVGYFFPPADTMCSVS